MNSRRRREQFLRLFSRRRREIFFGGVRRKFLESLTEGKFLAEAAQLDFVNLKGHRSVGGCRASIYNAMPMASVEALAEFMAEFRRING